MAATLDFYSVWYRDHLVQYIGESEQLHFGLMGPSVTTLAVGQLLFSMGINERKVKTLKNEKASFGI